MRTTAFRGPHPRPAARRRGARTPRRLVGLSVSLALVALGGAGCGGSTESAPPDHGSLAYVLGAHANSPASADSAELLEAAVGQQRHLAIVAVDGKPRILKSVDLDSRTHTEDARTREIAQFTADLTAALGQIAPVAPETDLLSAVALGARELTREPKTMVVEDSGLSTAGLLRFQEPGMLQADPDEVADQLERAKELPNLAGVTVKLRGIGDVTAPQEPLGTAKQNNLVAVWRAVLTRAGAKVEVDTQTRRGKAWPDTAPRVTVVPIAQPAPSVDPVPLPAAEFFRVNSPELIDRARAIDTLRPFAEQAKATPGRIDLVGTTARDGDRDGQILLSRQRADAIKALLVDLGVPAARITTDGVGSFGPWYIPDRADDGTMLAAEAARNRTVRIQFQKV